MAITFRPAQPQDMRQFGDLTAYAYAGAFGDGDDNVAMHNNRPEWTLCAFDGDSMVASYATIPFTARANGQPVALGGVTTVATAPEYRRRGLLRSITEQALAAQREAGQPVAALWASQAAIYQRYGYAAASALVTYQVDTVDLQLLAAPDPELEVSRVSAADALAEVKQIYRQFVATRTLYLHRSSVLWQAGVLSEDERSGPVRVAICRGPGGDARGYAIYTLRSDRRDHRARSQGIDIRDLAWLDIDAYRALWAFLTRHDLVGTISWPRAPLDDPLPELINEPRMLHAQPGEGVWLRIVDVADALAARGYQTDGELTLEISEDPLTPWNSGRYRLTADGGRAEARRTDAPAELTLSIKALASAWCGYRRMRELAAWGMCTGTAAALARADALFATVHAPHCPDHF